MSSLAVFDFDRTIVNDDSDATIINRLREKKPPPEWEAGNHDWTPYMSNVSLLLHTISFGSAVVLLHHCQQVVIYNIINEGNYYIFYIDSIKVI